MKAVVRYNKALTGEHFLLRLECKGVPPEGVPPEGVPVIQPGQFVMLRVVQLPVTLESTPYSILHGKEVPGAFDPLLRRPFSVYNAGSGWVELLYRVVGKGTALMAALKPGDEVDVMGPLGQGFPEPADPSKLIMVGGGIGIAPFYLLSKSIKGSGKGRGMKPTLLYGARGREDAVLALALKKLGVRVKVSTEDGSVGARGLVTTLLKKELKRDSIVYACGPRGMLKAVAALTKERGVRSYVSLEAAMACGIGVCLGCAVKAKAGRSRPGKSKPNKTYRMVCSEGPVFDAETIDWKRY